MRLTADLIGNPTNPLSLSTCCIADQDCHSFEGFDIHHVHRRSDKAMLVWGVEQLPFTPGKKSLSGKGVCLGYITRFDIGLLQRISKQRKEVADDVLMCRMMQIGRLRLKRCTRLARLI
jgi:hypothetical protein